MRILIVDDNPQSAKRIQSILSAAPDFQFLIVSSADFAHELCEFGTPMDVALVDLRLTPSENDPEPDSDGLAVCQKIRNKMPDIVIVGYSSSFTVESDKNTELKDRFKAMGADIVCSLTHFTNNPVSELRREFAEAHKRRSGTAPERKRRKMFVGSSTEGLPIAHALQERFDHSDLEVEVWDQTIFVPGDHVLEDLERAVREYQFAIFIFSQDDVIETRGTKKHVARDNVIFETGLFIGSLGRSRTYIVTDRVKKVSLPSDLAGLVEASFDSTKENLAAAINPACVRIGKAIDRVTEEASSF